VRFVTAIEMVGPKMRGLGGLRGLVLGSLSQRMLSATKVPVLIVH
jgi:nucleotide-binding universal stress UspA family protein